MPNTISKHHFHLSLSGFSIVRVLLSLEATTGSGCYQQLHSDPNADINKQARTTITATTTTAQPVTKHTSAPVIATPPCESGNCVTVTDGATATCKSEKSNPLKFTSDACKSPPSTLLKAKAFPGFPCTPTRTPSSTQSPSDVDAAIE